MRLALEPNRTHPEAPYGAFPSSTPPQGEPGPMEARHLKAPFSIAGQRVAGMSLQQAFTIYHTNFYGAAPAERDLFTAIPDG